jgi:hypothetical protein
MNEIQALLIIADRLQEINVTLESCDKTLEKLRLDLEVERGSRRAE